MQVCEFKAWFEGFTEDMTKLPTVKQWARIKDRIEDIDGVATTERVFIDRYWRRYEPYWLSTTHNVPMTWIGTSTAGGTQTVTSNVAFTALGRTEAASIAA